MPVCEKSRCDVGKVNKKSQVKDLSDARGIWKESSALFRRESQNLCRAPQEPCPCHSKASSFHGQFHF